MKERIDREKYTAIFERELFPGWMDGLLRDFAAEAKRRNGLDQRPRSAANGSPAGHAD